MRKPTMSTGCTLDRSQYHLLISRAALLAVVHCNCCTQSSASAVVTLASTAATSYSTVQTVHYPWCISRTSALNRRAAHMQQHTVITSQHATADNLRLLESTV
jgi:uncharacterized protein CbrC (UPF0167 family)